MLYNTCLHYQIRNDHLEIRENAFMNDPRGQNEVLGHFLKLGVSDRLQIAYFDYTK